MRSQKEEGPGSARERLLSAAMETLVERGYRGATSREIAKRAGVNEVTLFRVFSTKDDLLAAALVAHAEQSRMRIPVWSGDLERDLVALASTVMEAFLDDETLTVRMLPEVKRMPEAQQQIVRQRLSQAHESMMAVIRPYQASGELDPELGDTIWPNFIGPLLIQALDVQVGGMLTEFDASAYVRSFLRGAAGPALRARGEG